MSSDAKLHLSLKDGVFEISGSELFVSQQIENFKEVILQGLQNKTKPEEVFIPPENSDIDLEEKPVGNTITPDKINKFPRVLHIDDGKIQIIKKVTGSSNSQKSVNTALVYLWGNRAIGIDNVNFQEIRDQCKVQACLDPANFAAHMSKAIQYFVIDGKKNSNTKTCKLTVPGIEKAEELLQDLNDAV